MGCYHVWLRLDASGDGRSHSEVGLEMGGAILWYRTADGRSHSEVGLKMGGAILW